MNNKIKDFLMTFNGELENSNQYCNLQHFSDGFTEGICFPKIHLFDNDNNSIEYFEQLSLSRLVKTLNEVLKVAEEELSYRIEEFFAEKKKELKEKFPNLKIQFNLHNILNYYIFASGEYNEEKLYDALDIVKQDFEYIFEGLKLNIEI